MKSLAIGALGTVCFSFAAYGYEGRRANSVLLNGGWESARGRGDERAEVAAGQAKLKWKKVNLPGQILPRGKDLPRTVKFVWLRRKFRVSKPQAESLAVLRWNHITLGAAAFINGTEVGWNEPTGPYQVIVPKGVLKPGENEIVLKVCGAAGVRKAKSGYFMFGSGFATCHKRGMPAVTDDVWIDFARDVYVKWALAMPDLAHSKVRIRVTPTGLERISGLRIVAAVRPWPTGEVVGTGETKARSAPSPDPLGGEHFFVDVPMPGFKPWTYEDRNLYLAEVKVLRNDQVLDSVVFRFGMREIKVAGGNYKLNDKNLWLRGSNLVFEWNWGDVVKGKEKTYLVTEAREMSMNSFRTHTQPPPRLWADICDEHGTMILAELPVLYNYRDYKYTPEEYKIFHRNSLTDAAGWIARLWNHPSVVMWVLSNESRNDNRWERGPYQNLVNRLDPTRPTMRTGTDGTKENYDVHTCGNVTRSYAEGTLQTRIPRWFRTARGRTVTNSEYMNTFKRSHLLWTGKDDRAADALALAQLGAEHTEAMRRARLDGIWPYMYAGWTKTRRRARGSGAQVVWKAGFATPLSAAWHSSLSPVLASLDLFDANYLTGQEVATELHLINETWHEANVHVDLLLTEEHPEFVPEAACFKKPLAKWGFDFTLKADSVRVVPVKWKLPEQQGSYWLTARTTGAKKRPVLSQRFIRAVTPPQVPASARQRTFVVLGGGRRSAAYFKAKGLKTTTSLAGLDPKTHAVVVWNADNVKPAEKRAASTPLRDFAAAGGRVTVLDHRGAHKWSWKGLCNVDLSWSGTSRVFLYPGRKHPILRGIGADWMKRWNGLPGTVAFGGIIGPAMKNATKILWTNDPNTPVVAEVPAAKGGGVILFSRLDLHRRVDRSKPTYDPVADRILLNVVGR